MQINNILVLIKINFTSKEKKAIKLTKIVTKIESILPLKFNGI